ncbi:MAG: DUF5666 domain-containing protein [Chloroflexota bacterium]
MVAKLAKALWVILALSLGLAQPALAEGDSPNGGLVDGRGLGQVTAIGASDFTVETRRGTTHTLLVDKKTTFEARDGTPRSFSDLEVGTWVAGSYERLSDGRLLARRVILLGDELPHLDVRAAGEVTAVDAAGGTFGLHTRGGEDLTFVVDGDTIFRSPDGSVSGLDDLQPGMLAAVGARDEDGALVAIVVVAGNRPERPPRQRAGGEITSVHPGAGEFSLHTREGADLTFGVSERTRFLSRDGSVNDIHDLHQGMLAVVVYVEREDGTLEALAVGAGNPEDRPQVDVRAAGRIRAVGSDTFSLETRSGETLTFTVDGSTVFRSRDGSVNGLEDLKEGMLAVVGARELGNGNLRAVWVGVGRAPRDAPAPSE